MNCFPSMAKMSFSQQWEATSFHRWMIHLSPFLFASSSHTGLIFSLKWWKLTWPAGSSDISYDYKKLQICSTESKVFDILFTAVWVGSRAWGSHGVPGSIALLQGMFCWSRESNVPLSTYLALVSFCFFPFHHISVCSFLHSDHGPTVIIFQGLELIPSVSAVASASQWLPLCWAQNMLSTLSPYYSWHLGTRKS